MPIFNAVQIAEINAIIAEIEKSKTSKCEIGARDKTFLSTALKGVKEKRKVEFFKCKREYSDVIVTHFVKKKGLTKNRFHMNSQSSIYLLK